MDKKKEPQIQITDVLMRYYVSLKYKRIKTLLNGMKNAILFKNNMNRIILLFSKKIPLSLIKSQNNFRPL